jgi:hypothetical protein
MIPTISNKFFDLRYDKTPKSELRDKSDNNSKLSTTNKVGSSEDGFIDKLSIILTGCRLYEISDATSFGKNRLRILCKKEITKVSLNSD